MKHYLAIFFIPTLFFSMFVVCYFSNYFSPKFDYLGIYFLGALYFVFLLQVFGIIATKTNKAPIVALFFPVWLISTIAFNVHVKVPKEMDMIATRIFFFLVIWALSFLGLIYIADKVKEKSSVIFDSEK